MVEYIEREAVLIAFGNEPEVWCEHDPVEIQERNDWYYYRDIVEAIPAADVTPVRHGRWIGLEYDSYADGSPVYDLWECSECGEEVRGEDVPDTHPWCHACGALMDRKENEHG